MQNGHVRRLLGANSEEATWKVSQARLAEACAAIRPVARKAVRPMYERLIAYSECMTTRGMIRALISWARPRGNIAGRSPWTGRGVGIGVKFVLVLVALVPSLVAVGWVGVAAPQRARASRRLVHHHVAAAQDTAEVDQQVGAVGRLALKMIAENGTGELTEQRTLLFDVWVCCMAGQRELW